MSTRLWMMHCLARSLGMTLQADLQNDRRPVAVLFAKTDGHAVQLSYDMTAEYSQRQVDKALNMAKAIESQFSPMPVIPHVLGKWSPE